MKDEVVANAEWMVERQDHDDGRISYEVWTSSPYGFLFAIYEDLTPAAKSIACSIVAQHNGALKDPTP